MYPQWIIPDWGTGRKQEEVEGDWNQVCDGAGADRGGTVTPKEKVTFPDAVASTEYTPIVTADYFFFLGAWFSFDIQKADIFWLNFKRLCKISLTAGWKPLMLIAGERTRTERFWESRRKILSNSEVDGPGKRGRESNVQATLRQWVI